MPETFSISYVTCKSNYHSSFTELRPPPEREKEKSHLKRRRFRYQIHEPQCSRTFWWDPLPSTAFPPPSPSSPTAATLPSPLLRSTEAGATLTTNTRANIVTAGSHRHHHRSHQRLESTASGTIIQFSASLGMLPPLISSELIDFSLER